ncbi:D-aminoacyl-tRNA deacylase [Denitrificimonas caeni]|uniref:D-aminoacyl-tRNA deacylase n=1 Tax=Denitrificimonas caeni TaxID=521720 RepID=UPI0003B5156D|nr:D-aminoacyl-tRNA deacylase [Denitrificimonas caeni]
MKALLQRVSQASVSIDGLEVARIAGGLLVLVGIEPDDNQRILEKVLHKLLNYRVFSDEQERMNKSLIDVQGGLLLVSQFTLAADTRSGLRPGFSTAAAPAQAEALFEQLVQMAKQRYANVQTGQFGADMQVQLVNDGPVTFMLEV